MYGIEFTTIFEGELLKARAIGTAERAGFIGETEFAETRLAFARNMGAGAHTKLCSALREGAREALMGEQHERALAARAEGFR